jgi:peptidoglycan/LPS O-acetylase OafA/YrhL
VLAGGALPMAALTRGAGTWPVVALTVVVMVAAIAGAASSRPVPRMAGGIAGGVLAIILVTVNGRVGPWQGLVILAVMFTGTALDRAEHGQIGRLPAAVTSVLVLAGAITAGGWHAAVGMWPSQAAAFQVYWTGSVLLAALTFAGGWALRNRRIPGWLTWLGRISFSLYLLHPVLLMLTDQFFGPPAHDDAVRLAVFVLVLVGLSSLTYRYVEAPFQRLGRRIARRGSAPVRPAPLEPLPE